MKESQKIIPACTSCGQVILSDSIFDNQEEANAYALTRCSCDDARAYQEKQKQLEEREQNIEKVKEAIEALEDYCDSKKHRLSEEVKELLLNHAIFAIDGLIDSANIQFGRLKAKIAINAKGAVIVQFSYSDSVKMEA